MTQKERLIGVLARGKCVILRLSRMKFLEILEDNKSDKYEFKELEEKIRMRQFKCLRQGCWSCEKFEHSIKDCPLVHLVPDVSKVLYYEH